MKDQGSDPRGSFMGRGLRVDLSRGTGEAFTISEQWGRDYLGASGLAARLLYEPGNQDDCIIAPGLLNGLPVHTAAKGSVAAKSPLTGQWGEASLGGPWPLEFKRAGWDLVQLTGEAPRWTVIKIVDDQVSFEPADEFMGLSPERTEQAVRNKWGRRFQVGAIGVGGEHQVRYAGISAGLRWAGRCGLGADWGRRKVKAVAVAGSRRVRAVDPDGLKESVRSVLPAIRERTQSLHLYGTAGSTMYRENLGALPIKNFSQGNFAGAINIAGQTMVEKFHATRRACPHCPIACGKNIRVESLDYEGVMPEYEAVASLGSMLLIDDVESVVLLNQACNDYGLDVISAGVVVAFSIEAYEKGFLKQEDLDGLVPAWGSREYALAVLEKISRREGVGNLLAEGVREAARRLGPGASDLAVHGQGLEVPMQDPRAFVSLALTYAVSPRGASHCESMSFYTEQGFDLTDLGYPEGTKLHQAEGKGEMTMVMQDMATVYDSLGLCKFMLVAGIGPTTLARWIEAATGWEMSRDDLMKAGARTVAAKRLFNLDRLGLPPTPHLARRMRLEPRGTGGSAHSLPDLDTMVRDYFRARGWSAEGIPPDDQKPG